MNKSLLFIRTVMRTTILLYSITIAFSQLLMTEPSRGQVLAKSVDISYGNTTLYEAIRQLQRESNVEFAFDEAQLGLEKIEVASRTFRSQPMATILNELLTGTSIAYEGIGKRTVVLRREQQRGRITGRIINVEGDPLPKAGIRVVELNRNISADSAGHFAIDLHPGTYTLEVSYLLYQTQWNSVKITAGETSTLNFILQYQQALLDEVVVVGYGSQEKINLTGAVSTVKHEQLESRPITQASQALQGLVTGVFVNTATGEAGNDESSIVIRGIGSLNQSSAPLVLIDGIEGSINDVPSGDIESFSVLKDAAAAAIYGTRGAKGVILITTKRGRFNQPTVLSYRAYAGFSSPTVLPDMVIDSRTYMEMYRQAAVNSDRNFNFDDEDIDRYAAMPSTDHQKVALREAAPIHNHEITTRGGSERLAYFASLGYLDQDGWLRGEQNFKRYNTRVNLDAKLSEKASLGATLSYIVKDAALTPKDDGSLREAGAKGSTIFSGAIVGHPIVPIRTPSGFYGNIEQALGIERNRPNVQGIIDNEKGQLDQSNFMGNAFLNYHLLDGLTARMTLGLNLDNEQGLITRKEYQGYDAITEEALGDGNAFRNQDSYLEMTNTKVAEVTNIAQFNYEKITGKHTIKALGGFNRQTRRRDFNSITETQFGSTDLVFLGNGTARETGGVIGDRSSLVSFFGRVNYAFDDKYLFEANFRRDASSRFGADSRWGNFPSFSAGWILSNEQFWGRHFFNYLKLRGSWGVLGSEPSDRFGFLTEFRLGRDYIDQSGGAVTKLGNTNLKWEETATGNIGFDAGLFGNKLTVEGDYFVRKTTDILVGIDNPLTSGITGKTTFNAASVQNKGWEASLNYRHAAGDFRFEAGVNLTHVKNQILTINPDLTDHTDRIEIDRADNIWWIRGESFNVIYGHRFAGVFQSREEIENAPDHTFIGDPSPGDMRFTDQNGDGVIDLDDRVVLGKRNPEWFYGATINLFYKNFEFSALIQGIGNAYVNLARETGPFPFAGLRSYWLDAWTPENPNNEIPRVWVDRRGYNGQTIEQAGKYSSFWMQNRRYVRLKNVQVAYDLPDKLLEKAKLTGAKVFVNAQNLLTFTPLKDFDPERDPLQNHATATLPQSKIVTLGLHLTF